MGRVLITPHISLCFSTSNGISMSSSQVNASHWSYLSPEEAYQLMVSTYILAGTLAVSTLFRLSFSQRASYTAAKHSSVLDHVLGYIE